MCWNKGTSQPQQLQRLQQQVQQLQREVQQLQALLIQQEGAAVEVRALNLRLTQQVVTLTETQAAVEAGKQGAEEEQERLRSAAAALEQRVVALEHDKLALSREREQLRSAARSDMAQAADAMERLQALLKVLL